ncbi:Molybdenum-binding periplasmic protein [gamma proteobacterium IMCC2047]|nr:Molybdenum-binding periplasmic protein [gamma proteobacterium IMCC2047]
MKKLAALAFTLCMSSSFVQADTVELFAAGSLKIALTDVAANYEAITGNSVARHFGPSGLMRERIEQGETAHVFASANMKHPATLQHQGKGAAVVMFAQNKLCGLAKSTLKISSAQLLETLLDPAIRVGTSTPKADPSGDYAWQLFEKAEHLQTAAYATLDSKALKLTGGRDSQQAPEGRNTYGWVMENDRADVFLTYCTNALLAKRQVPELQILTLPDELSVGANYGLILLNGAPKQAADFARYVLSDEAQAILSSYGFTPVIDE